jgi:hypothetical protein
MKSARQSLRLCVPVALAFSLLVSPGIFADYYYCPTTCSITPNPCVAGQPYQAEQEIEWIAGDNPATSAELTLCDANGGDLANVTSSYDPNPYPPVVGEAGTLTVIGDYNAAGPGYYTPGGYGIYATFYCSNGDSTSTPIVSFTVTSSH